jgi:hypothetical protein
MGIAIDTVLVDLHNVSTNPATLTNAVAANGDSLAVRSFKDSGKCTLENVYLQGASAPRRFRLLSPRLHDNVTGVSFQALENPTEFLISAEVEQTMYSADQLVVQLDAAASSDTIAALSLYYTDAPGLSADLRTWDQVRNRIIDIKPVEVDCTSSATIGQWTDTLINTTENQLKADYEYALLGFEGSAAFCTVGIKGPCTSNLRICIPGASPTLRLTDYFIYQSMQGNRPYIPVMQANDRAATYVSVAANTASTADNVFAILARLG